ncbi:MULTISPECIES: phage antirepressor N-terminal domain-containing protein [Enterobacteriaceae]|uniref:phage antirepressor N-terminal domain-containing protein n=1 Tax=Enterobacteriaceae TaxID=543 RepID=UPI00190059E6|nr:MULTISPECIES: phage antirepressor N-terminal domain-containing protein [Enterobacteriaceae]MBJ8974924.1 phage antirepressor N-terminal domain-containing protein [Citrobacter freundii]MBJ9012416.1 phage antirepressor N-terminal domain-containing protein [Citrobacter freundii]MBJ9182964.1 phage antirepressor N-terminal domain-containing protein [Citrobacter freundii]MDU1198597.1 phage antirepressor N-terminal domain-containing protein [Kluyvera ascorbata]HED2323213.1 phage antirepressor N-ter
MSNLAIKQSACTINVPFHGNDLYVVNHNGEPYTPMKPIVEGMGMDWKSQHVKLTQRFAKGMVEITIPTAGGMQKMICLALRKLAAWLNTISPNKVRREIRERVIRYQEECDDVLYEYWTKGQVTNPRKTSTDERTPLRDAINMLVGKRGIMYPEAYSYVHQRFNVAHIDELPAEQLPVVIEYVHRLALEGEFLGKQEELPDPKLELPDITMEWWYRNNMQMQHDNPERRNNQPWNDVTLTPLMISGDNSPSPSLYLIRILEQMGFDMVGPRIEVEAMRSMLGKGKQKIRVMGDSQVKYLLSL